LNDIALGTAGGRPEREGPLLEEISRRIVHLYKESYGRGPTKARTYWEDDVITVVVRGGFTPDERTLREAGRGEAVLEHRVQFHERTRRSGRRVPLRTASIELRLQPDDPAGQGIEGLPRELVALLHLSRRTRGRDRYPLTTPIGRSRATRTASPARSTTSTTFSTSL